MTVLASALLPAGLNASAPFVPDRPEPLLESWRWTRFDQFDAAGFACMAEAADGTVWFGFRDRVVHFDGLQARAFGPAEGLVGAPVKSLCVSRNGTVYALTRTHFLQFNGRRWQVVARIRNPSAPGDRLLEAPDGAIWALTPDELLCVRNGNLLHVTDVPRPLSQFTIDAHNRLWLAPRRGGVIWECPIETEGLAAPAARRAHQVFPADSVSDYSLLAARDDSIWVVSESESLPGQRYSPSSGRWEPIDPEASRGTWANYGITQGPDGTIWICGQGRLQSFSPGGRALYTQADLNLLPYYRYILHAGRDQTLWLCGNGGYIYRIDCSDRHWSSYRDIGFQTEAPDGRRWFISRDHRVIVHQPTTGTWTQFSAQDGMIDHPVGLAVARDGTVWAAGSDRGRAAVARLEGAAWHVDRFPEFARGIARQSVYAARNGDMLFGAEFEKAASPGCTGGLLCYHQTAGTWHATTLAPPVVPFRIITLAEGDDGSLWMAGDSLWRLKDRHAVDPGFPAAASLPRPLNVANDAAGAVWISQWGGGVYRFAHGQWRHFSERTGLASDLVAGVAAAPDGSVWAASPAGLSRFDGTRWVRTALPSQFGLDLGPSHLRLGNDNSVWIVTNAQGWYETPAAGSRGTRTGSTLRSLRYHPELEAPDTIIDAGPVELAQKQPAYFVWHGVDRWSETPPEALEFSHRVDGGPWSPFSAEHSVLLGDLPAGPHRLEVRARDRDFNVDATPASMRFAVVPPVWRQPWFIGLLALFTAVIGGLLWLLVRLRIRHVLQLGELKVQFFTNISHELRTPLTVILGPLDHMIEEATEPRTRSRLEVIRQNAAHMRDLVDQILDFRRLQLRTSPPPRDTVDVVALLRAQHERFRAYAEDKALAFRFRASPDSFGVVIDRDQLIKIADNLVSNAIKYTPPGGEIEVAVACVRDDANPARGRVTLTVIDSGIGISAAEQGRIFQLFYRAAEAQALPVRGAGIGLAFVHELVSHAGGDVSVRSPAFPPAAPDRGTLFTVTLPVELAAEGETVAAPPALEAPTVPPSLELPRDGAPASRRTLLVVDDNPDIRRMLRDEFEGEFTILEAADGVRGVALAREHLPDCIIADLMMPELDGSGLCQKVKEDELTAHIPVILLTARQSTESQVRGLTAGADDYVVKPVSFSILRARVQNVIAARARLRERFGRQVFIAPQEVAITPANEQFVQRALQIVEAAIGDSDFDVETFARALGLSRASLFRKFKAISLQTPSDFIRDVRLERARQLLESGQYNVSQTASAVGFLDLSHFAACYRKKFGLTPSESAKRSQPAPA